MPITNKIFPAFLNTAIAAYDIIIGKAGGGHWDKLALGATKTFLASDGASLAYRTLHWLFDLVFSSNRGTSIFRGVDLWQALAPGVAGKAIISGGAGADLSFGDPAYAMDAGTVDTEHAAAFEHIANKAAINGYAGLGNPAVVPTAQLGSGVANATKFLCGDQSWQVPGGVGGNTKGHLDGFRYLYINAHSIRVEDGTCRDKTNTADVTMAVGLPGQLVDIANEAVINGLDVKTLTGTIAVNNGSSSVTGTNTLFLTEFNPQGITGTITFTNGSAAVTGSGTRFTMEIRPGDLIGKSTGGTTYFAEVVSVTDDTHIVLACLWLAANLTTAAAEKIENPTIRDIDLAETHHIQHIGSNTHAETDELWTGTDASSTAKIGVEIAQVTTPSEGGVITGWYYLWVCSGASGTGYMLSTRYTSLLAPINGYNTYFRLIGAVQNDTSKNFKSFTKCGSGRLGYVTWDYVGTAGGRFVNTGAATGAYALTMTVYGVPATATALVLDFQLYAANGAILVPFILSVGQLNQQNIGSIYILIYVAGTYGYVKDRIILCCSPCGGIQWAGFTYTNGAAYIDCAGYWEYV